MNHEKIFIKLNQLLVAHEPKELTSSWILKHAPQAYRYIYKHFRDQYGRIEWDLVTRRLERCFHARWKMPTKNQKKVDLDTEFTNFYSTHKNKLYVFITRQNPDDKYLRDTIAIGLARLAQRGHERAGEELLSLMRLTVDDWIEVDPRIARWRGYEELIMPLLERCIRGYRYSGTFVGYVRRTLECAGRGLIPLEAFSINQTTEDGKELAGWMI